MKTLKDLRLIDSIKVALFVGTILCIINQYDVLLSGTTTMKDWVKIGLNFIVPFSVATYSKFQLLKKYNS